MMKKILSTLTLSLLALVTHAQFTTDYLRAADGYFRKQQFASAAEYYEKHLAAAKGKGGGASYNPYTIQTKSGKAAKQNVSSISQARYNVAECYRALNFPQKALEAYEKVLANDAAAFPLAGFHHASQLRALGKYQEAEAGFQTFVNGYTTKDEYLERARREIQSLVFIQEQLNRPDIRMFKVDRFDQTVNAGGANYAPSFGGGNEVYFTSTRTDSNWQGAKYANRLYQGVYQHGSIGEVRDAGLPADATSQQGVASVSPDGKSIYFTRWTVKDGKKTAFIFRAAKGATGWEAPVALGSAVNQEGSSAQQPFLDAAHGRLFFSSDRPGGLGGFDIWMVQLDTKGNADNPVNLGASVNSPSDEHAPAYHEPSQSLVFSTNGRVGMGGFDLFQSKAAGKSWSDPVNLGYPVNSSKDDIYFVSRSANRHLLAEALFSSDRAADCCLETFYLRKTIEPNKLSGIVVSCADNQPVGGASVTIAGKTVTTGADGSYAFLFDEFAPVSIQARAEGFEDNSVSVKAPGEDVIRLQAPLLCLKPVQTFPPPVGTIETLVNINFAFDQSQILDSSKAYLDLLAEKLIASPSTILEIGGHTDSKGGTRYNQRLSERRAMEVVKYLISRGAKAEQLVAKGYGESQPLAPNASEADGVDHPEGRRLNRRTEFKVLQR
jgi:outer membrane protein OmpA-like peptidoglycan-associated protein/tetratricopeptide (TPR) repeat protein